MSTTAVIRLTDMTFLLMENDMVLLALSYRKNAAALASLLKVLNINNLYLMVEPNIEHDIENSSGRVMKEWSVNDIAFSLPELDIAAIKSFSTLVNAENTYIVNTIFDYGFFSRLPSFHLVKTYKNSYAYLSYEDKNLTYLKLEDSLEKVQSSKEKFYDEVHVIDIDKVKGKFPELAYKEAIEIATLAPLLYATMNSRKIDIETAFAVEEEVIEEPPIEEVVQQEIKEEEIIPEQIEDKEDKPLKGTVVEQDDPEMPIHFQDEKTRKFWNGEYAKRDAKKMEKRRKRKEVKSKKSLLGGLLTACILLLSICIGTSFGTRSFPGYITVLANELHLTSEETKMFQEQEAFYQNKVEKLNGKQNTFFEVYSALQAIPVQGVLGEMREYSDSIIAVYYLLNNESIDPLVEKIEENYTVSSVSATDSIKLNNSTVSVYSITLH